jgi:hypothetical protein
MLTEAAIRNAKPREKPYKLFDERGLFMLVAPTGGRLWRFRYRHGGKEKLLSLGAYPTSHCVARAKSGMRLDGWSPTPLIRAPDGRRTRLHSGIHSRSWLASGSTW